AYANRGASGIDGNLSTALGMALADGRPFAEEDWLGQVLIIGEARIRLNRPISRCQMINVDPDTAVRNTAVLQMVAQTRNNHVGIGCTPETPGLIRVGDTIKLAN
ncbi:MAG TPA: MOSC domain-containing protein, partial [Anaerolineae bacterium]|nr:MOSC domain-containing protein [Anaerolineae bacterium]